MGLFSSKKREEIDELNRNVTNSIGKINNSLKRFGDWIHYLNNKDEHHDFKIYELEKELIRQGLSKEKVRSILQAKYQYHYLVEKVKEVDKIKEDNVRLQAKLEELETIKQNYAHLLEKTQQIDVLREYYSMIADRIKHLDEKIDKKQAMQQAVQKPTLKERIIRKFTQNSKDHTETFVLNLIKKYGEITALQLRDIVVEEQGICSKSSFYRALEELEKKQLVKAERSGKEKKFKAIHVLE